MPKMCTVVAENITDNDIDSILEEQRNTSNPNNRIGQESAFSKALQGSKLYLEVQGYIQEAEE